MVEQLIYKLLDPYNCYNSFSFDHIWFMNMINFNVHTKHSNKAIISVQVLDYIIYIIILHHST